MKKTQEQISDTGNGSDDDSGAYVRMREKRRLRKNLLKDMAKNMKDTESVVANMKMDMEMGDDTTTIGIQMDMDIDMDLKSGESHAKRRGRHENDGHQCRNRD